MLHVKRCILCRINSMGAASANKIRLHGLSLGSSSLRFTSTKVDTDNDSFMVSYLVNSCQLSPESALSASKFLKFRSSENPDSVIRFLGDHGFSQDQISELIRKWPQVLACKPQKTLSTKFQFFYSAGFSADDLARFFVICPRVLNLSIDGLLLRTINCLAELLQSHDKAIAFIKQFPSIFRGQVVEIVALLREHQVPLSMISLFVTRWPIRLSACRANTVKASIEKVEAMGFSPSKSQFVLAVGALTWLSKSVWEKRLNAYKHWGLSDEDVMTAFRKLPWCMMAFDDTIMKKMDFLVREMSFEPAWIVQRPGLLSFSLEKRMIPRASVIQYLISKGLLEKKRSTLCYLFSMPDKAFFKKCVNCYEEAPEIMRLYAGKLDSLQPVKFKGE